MLRYYMTPETQQALIAESNRLIAHRSMTRHSGKESGRHDADEPSDHAALGSAAGTDSTESGDDSSFARLVADLQAVSAVSRSQ